MPKNLELEEVKEILAGGRFEDLIGAVENEQVECKSAPYQVQKDVAKQELAKDVSGLANADGGVILIGVKTHKNPSHFGDEIIEIHPFSRSLINQEQYQDILQSWIYPSLQQVDVRWFPSAADQGRGIVAILVPNQPLAERPFLVTKTLNNDEGKLIETVFGYFERKRAKVNHLSVQQLHLLVREGRRADSLNRQYEDLQGTLQQILARLVQGEQLSLQKADSDLLQERVDQALIEADLKSKPAFVLVAFPIEKIEIPTLFEARNSDIVRLLENPPELRNLGFGLKVDTPRIVKGQLRRATIPGYKSLELWRDGTLVFVATGDDDFLSWGTPAVVGLKHALLLNQLVLIESTYLFVELSRQVFDLARPRPKEIQYQLELRNMTVENKPCMLDPGPLSSRGRVMQLSTRAPDPDGAFGPCTHRVRSAPTDRIRDRGCAQEGEMTRAPLSHVPPSALSLPEPVAR